MEISRVLGGNLIFDLINHAENADKPDDLIIEECPRLSLLNRIYT
jgi:hypothetical protein